jgi:hypothetical protein
MRAFRNRYWFFVFLVLTLQYDSTAQTAVAAMPIVGASNDLS